MARAPRTLSIDAPTADVVVSFHIDASREFPVFACRTIGGRPLLDSEGNHRRSIYGNLLYEQAKDGADYTTTWNTVDPVVAATLAQALGAATADIVARVLTAMGVEFTQEQLMAGVLAYHATGDNLFSAMTRATEDLEDARVAGDVRSPHITARGRGVPHPPPAADPAPPPPPEDPPEGGEGEGDE